MSQHSAATGGTQAGLSEAAQERQVLIFTSAAHCLTHLFEFMLPACTMYLFRDLQVTSPELQVEFIVQAGTLMVLLYGVLSLVWGLLADRFQSNWVLGAGMLLAGSGFVLASFQSTLPMLWAAFGLSGVGMAAYHPVGLAMISKHIRRRGWALGLNGIWGNVGIVAGPLIGGVGGYYLGWRIIFAIAGGLGLLAGVSMWLLKMEEHRDTEKAPLVKLDASRMGYYFFIACVAMTVTGLMYRANVVTLPLIFEEKVTALTQWLNAQSWVQLSGTVAKDGGTGTLSATLLMALALFGGVIGQMVGGRIADRFDLRKAYLVFFALSLPTLAAMARFEGSGLLVVAMLYSFFSLGMQPIENSLVARLSPPRWRSTSYAIKFTLTFGVGTLGLWIATGMRAAYGSGSVYWVLAGMNVLLLGVVGWLILASRSVDLHQRTGLPAIPPSAPPPPAAAPATEMPVPVGEAGAGH